MGMSADGLLVYGYDLGGSAEWKIRETGEYGEPNLPWYGDEDDFGTVAMRRLRAEVAGFTETWETRTGDGYHTREREADKSLGVDLEFYCSHDYPMHILGAAKICVDQGYTHLLDFDDLRQRQEGCDEKLQRAITALGVTPLQDRPGWLLASIYG
jgi:hypothetical protein